MEKIKKAIIAIVRLTIQMLIFFQKYWNEVCIEEEKVKTFEKKQVLKGGK